MTDKDKAHEQLNIDAFLIKESDYISLDKMNIRPLGTSKRDMYEPFYPFDKVDYNVNSDSYYHFLGRYNHALGLILEYINRLLDRDVKVKDTPSIEFKKDGDWHRHGECLKYDDEIVLYANVILSKVVKTMTLINQQINLKNALTIEKDGVYAPDYIEGLRIIEKNIQDIHKEINNINQKIENINNKIENLETIINNQGDSITKLENALQKIVNNLYESGGSTTNNIYNYQIVDSLATGNINVNAGKSVGVNLIRTHKGNKDNDLWLGLLKK